MASVLFLVTLPKENSDKNLEEVPQKENGIDDSTIDEEDKTESKSSDNDSAVDKKPTESETSLTTTTNDNNNATTTDNFSEVSLTDNNENSIVDEQPLTNHTTSETDLNPAAKESVKSQDSLNRNFGDSDVDKQVPLTDLHSHSVKIKADDTISVSKSESDSVSNLVQDGQTPDSHDGLRENSVQIVDSKNKTDKEKVVKFSLGNNFEDDKTQNDTENKPGLETQFSVDDWEPVKPTVENVKECLSEHEVKNTVWRTSDDGVYIQVNFVVDAGNRCEEILKSLTELGVGFATDSSISMFAATYHCKPIPDNGLDNISTEDGSYIEEFKKSVKSRLVVQEVVESIRTNSRLTFDYIVLTALASMIACMGLVENSSVILVASMLISPLMGPIMAGTFGFVIQNIGLRNTGVKVEIIGLSLCVICGFVLGIIFGIVGGTSGWPTSAWPTMEMSSRGELRSLWVGFLIALPSGAGVALSILGGNAGSLVGVAISASLLPPAVNAGMLWAVSAISTISPPQLVHNGTKILTSYTGYSCLPLEDNAYVPVYSCSLAVDMFFLGVISLSLTLLNILVIFLASIGVLKVKEVAPHTAVSTADQTFWKKDIQVARQSYRTLKGIDSSNIRKQFLNELKSRSKESDLVNSHHLSNIVKDIINSNDVQNVTCRLSSGTPPHIAWSSSSLAPSPGYPDAYQTVRNQHPSGKESVYKTITSYYGQNRVTHKIIKRSSDFSLSDETKGQRKKKLQLQIPKIQPRKSSEASLPRTFVITTVHDDPENPANEESLQTEKDKLL